MDFKDIFKKYGDYAVALILFVIAASIYCRPALIGEQLFASDSQAYIGASQESREYRNQTSTHPLWNGSMFCGMPNYQIDGVDFMAESLMSPLRKIMDHRNKPIRMMVLYFVCFFIMMRSFGISRWMSIAGAFAVTLSSYFLVIIPAGHFTKVTSIALCGVIIGAFHLIFSKKYILGAVLTMVFVALGFKPHPQMFYYFYMLIGVMWIALAISHIREKRWKDLGIATAVFALATIIGLGTGTANVFANMEYTSESIRGRQSDLAKVEPKQELQDLNLEQDLNPERSLDLEQDLDFKHSLDFGPDLNSEPDLILEQDSVLEQDSIMEQDSILNQVHEWNPELTQEQSEGVTETKGLDLEYATEWSYGLDETFSLLIPGFKGGANTINVGTDSRYYRELTKQGIDAKAAEKYCAKAPMYWGEQPFTDGNVYVGAIIFFLFVLGLFIVKGPYKWALLFATVMSVLLSWGSNFMWLTELFFKYFPLYSKFRAVSSILVVAEVAIPLLAFLALKELSGEGKDRKQFTPYIWASAAITAGICLFFALFGFAIFDFTSSKDISFTNRIPVWFYDAICRQRRLILFSDSLRSAAFIVVSAALLLLYAKGKIKKTLTLATISVLTVFDLWNVDKRYFNDSSFVAPHKTGHNAFRMYDYEAKILQKDTTFFRVFNLTTETFNESRTSYWLKSLGGYSAARLRRYNDVINEHLTKPDIHPQVVGMLNAKYVIVNTPYGPEAQLNTFALGNAWFVDTLTVVDNADEECSALNRIDLTHEAVLDKSFASYLPDYKPAIPEDATVILFTQAPDDMDYYYTTSQPGTLVFSEIYYPYGWKAFLDGKKIDHYRVNYLLRAVNVPAGLHRLHFVFKPDSVRIGNVIATIFIILMYASILLAIGYGICKSKNYDFRRLLHK